MSHFKTNLKKTYDAFASERESSSTQEWKVVERSDFLQRLQTEGKTRLLEIGAGTGRDSLFFQEKGLTITAVDLSDEMVAFCRDKGLDAQVMDFYELKFDGGSFDAVYALNCLLHVPKADLPDVLTEIKRVLKPDGLFLMGVYGGQNSEGIWEQDHYEPKRFFSMYSDELLVQAVGQIFEIVDFHTVSMGEGSLHFQSLTLRKTGK
jgi:ubiquinone/menaquinone biosynthesis C-methylase UbiE